MPDISTLGVPIDAALRALSEAQIELLADKIAAAAGVSVVVRGTAAALATLNATYAAGTLIYETDVLKFKFADGTTVYNDLDYAQAGAATWAELGGIPAAVSAIGALTAADGSFVRYSGTGTAVMTPFAEAVDDRVATLLVAGTAISLVYDDDAKTLTINSTAPFDADGYIALLEAIQTEGGLDYTATATLMAGFVADGGLASDYATAAQIWAGTAETLLILPVDLLAAYEAVSVTPSAGNIALDFHGAISWRMPMAADTTITAINNASGWPRYLVAIAEGGDRWLTVTEADAIPIGWTFDEGVFVPEDERAVFEIQQVGAYVYIKLIGVSGVPTDPVTLTIVAATPDTITLDGRRIPYAATGTLIDATNFLTPTWLNSRPRLITLAASGSPRAVTATGFDRLKNFVGGSVTVQAGQEADFIVQQVNGQNIIRYCGQSA